MTNLLLLFILVLGIATHKPSKDEHLQWGRDVLKLEEKMDYQKEGPAQEWVDIEFDLLKKETPRAILVLIDDKDYWIPKSQIRRVEGNWVMVTEWIAEEKGLI